MLSMRTIVATLGVGLAMALAVPIAAPPAMAQQVDVEVVPPDRSREPLVIPPGDHYEAGRPSDAEHYPRGPRVRFDPAFIRPLSVKTQTPTSTGRAGIAGWTSPNTPVGPQQVGWNEVTGWFALGFAVEWGGPPPAKRPVR
jgi:hypothetical protein